MWWVQSLRPLIVPHVLARQVRGHTVAPHIPLLELGAPTLPPKPTGLCHLYANDLLFSPESSTPGICAQLDLGRGRECRGARVTWASTQA